MSLVASKPDWALVACLEQSSSAIDTCLCKLRCWLLYKGKLGARVYYSRGVLICVPGIWKHWRVGAGESQQFEGMFWIVAAGGSGQEVGP